LDARPAGVEQADHRRPDLHRLALDLDDLGRVRARQAAAEHGEVLGEDVDDLAVDRAPAGDDAVAGHLLVLHAEVGAAVLDEHVELLERALVQQQVDPLAGGQLALGVLGGDPRLAAAGLGLIATTVEFVENVLHARTPCRTYSVAAFRLGQQA